MTKKTSRNRRLFMTKNLILMLVMLVVIVMAISAWFSVNKTVTANSIAVQATSTEIDIAECIKTWDSNYTVLTDGPGEFGDNVIFKDFTISKDCTGGTVESGDATDVKLIVPEFNVTKDFKSVKKIGKEVNNNLSAGNAVSDVESALAKEKNPDQDAPEYQYIQREFYVRSKNKDLLLEGNSQLLSHTEKDGKSISVYSYTKDGVTVDKKSAYGDFNVDGLAGAIRVALIGEAATTVNQNWQTVDGVNKVVATNTARRKAEKQILWVPRPDLFLKVSDGEGLNDWELKTGITKGGENGSETYKHSYYKTEGNGVKLVDEDTDSKTVVSSGRVDGLPVLGSNVNITDFTYSDELDTIDLVVDKTDLTKTDKYYVTKYTMKIWIEGTDAEARRAMDGGEFDITLNFL